MLEILSRVRLPVAPVLPDEIARKADLITGEGVNYSLSPLDTGVKWIDGQPVYRRVFITASGPNPNTDNVIIDTDWGFHGLVRLDGYLRMANGTKVPLQYYGGAADSYLACRIDEAGVISEKHGGVDMNARPMAIIIDYISAPVGASTWDMGSTIWDAGGSTWD